MAEIFVIAEMAWAHEGSIDKALAIMRAAKEAGADAVGIHLTDLETYMAPHYGGGKGAVSAGCKTSEVYEFLTRINLSAEDWLRFAGEARAVGIALCLMPNDLKSLYFAESEIAPEMYVVPAAAFVEEEFLFELASKKRKTLFRIGGGTLGEIEKAVEIFHQAGNADIVLLHGIQAFPTRLEDANISRLSALKSTFCLAVGLADHIDGGSPLAKALPLLALPYGAEYIEKHITLNRDEKGVDFESALDPEDFKEFVGFVRAAETALGRPHIGGLSEAETRYRDTVRKKMVAAHDIPPGQPIRREDIAFKRCDGGMAPDRLEVILGRKARTHIKKDEVVAEVKLQGD